MGKFSEISWPREFSELKRIEELLVCGICYDYMETSVMTPCSHNYCSLCIRKYLHYKTQCPACFEKTFEKDLHTNRILDEIILYFGKIREKLVNCITGAEKSSHADEAESNEILSPPPVRPARTNQLVKSPQKLEKEKTPKKKEIVEDSSAEKSFINMMLKNEKSKTAMTTDRMSSPSTSGIPKVAKIFTPKSRKILDVKPKVKQVACPVCSVEISEIHINKHLDACLRRESMPEPPRRVETKRKPLPKLVIKLMKDTELKKKMREYNLSIFGDRKTLENRFQRYCTLYNAECDKEEPRSPAELVRQCEEEESLETKMQKSNTNLHKFKVTRYAEQNVIETAQKTYLDANKQNYKSLIEAIKKREKAEKTEQSSPEKNYSIPDDIVDLNSTVDSEKIATSSPVKGADVNSSRDGSENNISISMFESGFQDTDSESSCPLQRYTSDHPMSFLSVEIDETPMSPLKIKPSPRENKEHTTPKKTETDDLKMQNSAVQQISLNVKQNLSVFELPTDTDSSENEIVESPPPREKKKRVKLSERMESGGKTTMMDDEVDTHDRLREIQAKRIAKSIVNDFIEDSDSEELQELGTRAKSSQDLNVGKENEKKANDSIAACRPVRKRNHPSRFSDFETRRPVKLAQPTRLGSIESLQKEIDETRAAGLAENDDNTLKRRRRRKCVSPPQENKNPPSRPVRKRDTSTVLQKTAK